MFENEIRDALREIGATLNIPIAEVPTEVATALRHRVLEKYTNGLDCYFLWECLTESVGVQNEEMKYRIHEYIGANPCYMFFTKDTVMVHFQNGMDAVKVLYEMFHTEFFVTDAETSYLICFNHHDYVIASGAAMPWLQQVGAEPDQ